MNRPGESVLAKFRSLRPAEKALLSLIYILSAMTKCGPKLLFGGPIGWGTVPHWIGLQKSSFGPNFDIGEFYDRGGPCARGPAYHSSSQRPLCSLTRIVKLFRHLLVYTTISDKKVYIAIPVEEVIFYFFQVRLNL